MGKQVEAAFICYDTDRKKYIYKVKDCICSVDHKTFQRVFVRATNSRNSKVHMPVTKTKKDFEIDGLFLGWLWYIFLMAISSIFKDAIGLWILISVVFFSCRSKKIKEEGTYIEW
jgi:hypothetical protein